MRSLRAALPDVDVLRPTCRASVRLNEPEPLSDQVDPPAAIPRLSPRPLRSQIATPEEESIS
jgi:hypothetical protein